MRNLLKLLRLAALAALFMQALGVPGAVHAGETTWQRLYVPGAPSIGPVVHGLSLPGCPNGASVSLNFATGQYCGGSLASMVSLSRASSGLAQDTSGTWYSFGSNVPRITNQGFLIEEARTNKSTNFNANPTDLTGVTLSGDAAATLTVVSDTAALAAAGLQNIATSGKVYKLDNSAGTTNANVVFGGLTGNTNTHTSSLYARGSGSATVGIALGASLTVALPFTPLATYGRYLVSGTPSTVSNNALLRAAAGSVVYFILNQLEEGAFVTSPIVIAGASASRAADVPQLIGPALTAALNAKAAFFQTLGVAGGSAPRLVEWGGGQLLDYSSSTTVADAGVVAATFGTGNYGGTAKTSYSFDAGGRSLRVNGGTLSTSAAAVTGISGAAYLGNRSAGDRALNGYMQRFALSSIKGQFDGMTAP